MIFACIANSLHSVFQHREVRGGGKPQKVQALRPNLSKGLAVQHRDSMSVKREKLEESGGRGRLTFCLWKLGVVLDQAQLFADAGDVRKELERSARFLAGHTGNVVELLPNHVAPLLVGIRDLYQCTQSLSKRFSFPRMRLHLASARNSTPCSYNPPAACSRSSRG